MCKPLIAVLNALQVRLLQQSKRKLHTHASSEDAWLGSHLQADRDHRLPSANTHSSLSATSMASVIGAALPVSMSSLIHGPCSEHPSTIGSISSSDQSRSDHLRADQISLDQSQPRTSDHWAAAVAGSTGHDGTAADGSATQTSAGAHDDMDGLVRYV